MFFYFALQDQDYKAQQRVSNFQVETSNKIVKMGVLIILINFIDTLQIILVMLGGNLNQNNHLNLFSDWLNPNTGRRSRAQSRAFIQEYHRAENTKSFGTGMIEKIMNASDVNVDYNFQKEFTFGKTMEIWRKGKIKTVVVFLDPSAPTLIWVSSKTKAFLFDLTYTTVNRFDLELEKSSNIKDYIVLHYFQQSLPIIFRNESVGQVNKYFDLFNNYIIRNRFMNVYPPYFSRIMKLYTMESTKDRISRKKKASDVLKASQHIGLTQKTRNWAILQAVVSKDNTQKLTSNTLVSQQHIGIYFKIQHCCEEIKHLFQKYSNVKLQNYNQYLIPYMRRDAFWKFLMAEQKESQVIGNQVIEQTQQNISFYDFCCYLLSQKSNYVMIPQQIDENLPLTDYFCYSSHNTYLSGNQLTSDSKIQRYIEDLQGGIKCVQLDVHNDGSKPIITHGVNDKSLCKPIDFEQTIEAINRFCEHHPNHYPIVLSVQNHASDANRYKMLNILHGIFGKKLLIVNQIDPNESLQTCKTLAQLRGKIIIKTDSNINEIYPYRKNAVEKSPVKSSFLPYYIPANQPPLSFKKPQFQDQFDRFQSQVREFQVRKSNFSINNPKQLYIPLAQMTKICGMFKSPSGIHNEDSVGYECTSLTNQKANKTDYNMLLRYTKRSWLRIYPLGTEIASSNYNPLPALKVGAQIIALNTQTKDNYAWLMMSYFTAGRPLIPERLGFIPKPLYLRTNEKHKVERMISIKIISSNQKVIIKFYGVEEDTKLNSNATFDFHIKNYFQGFLMFEIGTKFKQCIPLRYIRQGYRVLMAKNEMFRDSGIRILVLVTVKDLQMS